MAGVLSVTERDAINERRAILIDKDLNAGLTFNESIELNSLDLAIDRYLTAVHPIPREDLEWLRARVSVLTAIAEGLCIERVAGPGGA